MKIQFRGSVLCTLLLVATLTVGCLGGGGVGPSEIEPWSLDGPTLRIGSMDEGPEALTAVRDLAVGPSGNIFVLLPQDHQVRVFDPSGRFIREIGREGRGPGELQRPTALGFLGDTLWVHDPGLGRRSRYTLDGQALGDPSDPRGEPSEERLSVSFAEPLADGAGLFLTAPAFRSEWEGTDHPCPILVLPPGSEGPDTVAFRSLAHDRALIVDQAGGRIVSVMITSQPFSDETLWDLTKDGTSLVLVDRIVADADGPTTFRPSRVTLRGDTSFSKGIPYEPVPVSAPHLDSVVRRAFGGGTAVKEADARKVLFLPNVGRSGHAVAPVAPAGWSMLARVLTAAVQGVDSYLVRVEVNLASGLPAFTVVGLAEGAVREGRERVHAALRNVGYPLPQRRITVNLAPADVKKEGSAFDLSIAVGLLVAARHLDRERAEGVAFLGELGLGGELRPVRGVLPVAARCREAGVRTLVVPEANAREAAVVEGLEVLGARTLGEVSSHLNGGPALDPVRLDPAALLEAGSPTGLDLRDVRGQEHAKRALEVAAAGAHNLLFLGPPGSGKTMLARRLPGILPPLSLTEALEVTRVHSVAGRIPSGGALVTRRPFRAPHHTVSNAGLVGGGLPLRPGEISLAHHGVLFLDELAEFHRNVLEVLRQPLEDGRVLLSRARGSVRFPARFLLVGAMNPCPCGYHGDGSDRCLCDPTHIARYLSRVSGPLMDRIDLHVEVPAVPFRSLSADRAGEPSEAVRARVVAARSRQLERFAEVDGVHANGQMGPGEIRRWCRPSRSVARLLQQGVDHMGLSARAYHRVLKVARTLADLEGRVDIRERDAREALQYRALDRRGR